MPTGYAHVFALPAKKIDSKEIQPTMYQFTFDTGGNAYARVFTEDGLIEFLAEEIAVRADVLKEALDELSMTGKTNIPNIEMTETDAAAMGLQEAGVDY